MKVKTVHICKGCKELMEEQYGPSLGYASDVVVKIVPTEECDYFVLSDGKMRFEHKDESENK